VHRFLDEQKRKHKNKQTKGTKQKKTMKEFSVHSTVFFCVALDLSGMRLKEEKFEFPFSCL